MAKVTAAFFLFAVNNLALCLLAVNADVQIDVDLRNQTAFQPFPHYWKRSFGSGHAALSIRPDWQAHLKQAVDDLGLRGVRFHGIFDDDMGPVVPSPTTLIDLDYNFTLIDRSWDYQISLGVVPLVELSFMPCVLANCSWHGINPGAPTCRSLEFHYQGVKQQPTDWNDWYNLVKALVQHAVDRYGREEVLRWNFEVWNEGRWMGMPFPQPYLTLFNASSRAIKAVDPRFRVGGPASANLAHVRDFVASAKQLQIPFDFVSTHHYPTDSCQPQAVGNRSVWDPDCFKKSVQTSRATVPDTPFYLTETNVGCCLGYSQHDTSAAAAFAFKTVADLHGVVDLMSWWTFSDVFEEGGFPNKEFTNIYGLMTVHGVPKPGWRGFQLLAGAGDQRVPCHVSRIPLLNSMSPAAADVTCLQGGMSGGDLFVANMTVAAADNWCLSNSKCAGFTRTGQYPTSCSSKNTTTQMHFKDAWGASRRDSDPMLTSWLSGVSPSPPTPPTPPTDALPITAFATANASASSAAPLGSLRVYLGYWSVVASSIAPPAAQTVKVVVNGMVTANGVGTIAHTVTLWRIDETHANPLQAWQDMGSPASPSSSQLADLIESSVVRPEQVQAVVTTLSSNEIEVALQVQMSPNSVVMVSF